MKYFFTCLCCSQNSFAFLIWWIVSEMELEKSRTILHIGDKTVHWQQDHIHNFIIFTKYLILVFFCQTIPKRDPENLANLLPPVPRNPPTLPLQSSKSSRGIRKKNLSVNKLMLFYFLLELKIAFQMITESLRVSCLPYSVDHKVYPLCYQNCREDKRSWGWNWEWSD